jgi:intergrase/recombinase
MMDFQTALLAAVGGLVSAVVFLVGGIVYLYKRDIRRQQLSEARVEAIRKSMNERMEQSEANCHKELKEARKDIDRLNEDVSKLSMRDRDMAIAAILLYAEKRESDRDLMEKIAVALGVDLPATDPSRRTTASLKAITGARG